MEKRKLSTREMVLAGMMTALLAVLSIVEVPMPSGMPLTLQTFAVALCGYVLGKRLGGVPALLYLLLGAVGIPVFAGMSGGMGILLGPTGGFLFGFVPMAALCGLGAAKGWHGKGLILGLGGLAVCHVLGILHFSLVTGTGLLQSLLMASAPFLIKDVLSVAAARAAALAVRKALSASALLFGCHA